MSIKPVDMQIVYQNSTRVENPHAGNRLESQQQQFNQALHNQTQRQQETVIKTASSDSESNINKDRHNKNQHHGNQRNRRQRDQEKPEGKNPPKTSLFDATI